MGGKEKKGTKSKKEDAESVKIGNILATKHIGYEDMTLMENMTLDGVLSNLKDRFLEDLMYVSYSDFFLHFTVISVLTTCFK